MNLQQLTSLFTDAGAKKLYAKSLAENDNSKNQVYFAGAVEALQVFPSHQVFAANTTRGPSFKATLDFGWLLENGNVALAPEAKLILYSQYPEVRFSGFLQGCRLGPGQLMMDRRRARSAVTEVQRQLVGRILFLAVTNDGRTIGYVAAGNSEIAAEFSSRQYETAFLVFKEIPLRNQIGDAEAERLLLSELHRIHNLGWIDSKQLNADWLIEPCAAPNCGGLTLEAEFRIRKNSSREPDFEGWEIKQHAVANFERPASGGAITLMTPEPTGGFYKDHGVEAFIRKFGYPDRNGIPDRLNFGGIHRIGERQERTKLMMMLRGYDLANHKITDANGAIALINDEGEVAAEWAFTGILSHWSRKHMRAVYVPSKRRIGPTWQYCYGNHVRLARRTDSLRLLAAFASGEVYYDPGIKLENASTAPVTKRRSQFRISSGDIPALYETVNSAQV